ncbi:unnamed protein product [Ixodes pacificus]
MQPTYGERCLDLRSVRWWCCEFDEGREDLQDNERSGRPRSSLTDDNVSRVDAMVKTDPRVHHKDISRELAFCKGVFTTSFKGSLGCRNVSCLWVPKGLDDMMESKRMIASLNHLQRYAEEGEGFLDRIVTGDETWILYFTPQLKQQSIRVKTSKFAS